MLTMIERMTRELLIIPLANKNADTVLNAFYELKTHYEEHFNEVFKTITTDQDETEADAWSSDTLISKEDFDDFVEEEVFSATSIRAFA